MFLISCLPLVIYFSSFAWRPVHVHDSDLHQSTPQPHPHPHLPFAPCGHWNDQHVALNAAWPTDLASLHGMRTGTSSVCHCSSSEGWKRPPTFFLFFLRELWRVCSVHVWMLWFRMSLILCDVCSSDGSCVFRCLCECWTRVHPVPSDVITDLGAALCLCLCLPCTRVCHFTSSKLFVLICIRVWSSLFCVAVSIFSHLTHQTTQALF